MGWYTDETVDAAIEWITQQIPSRADGTVGYAELLGGVGLPDIATIGIGQLSVFMGTVHRAEQPGCPVDSVVVNRDTGWPGHGYWEINGLRDPARDGTRHDMDTWTDQQQRVWRTVGHPNAERG